MPVYDSLLTRLQSLSLSITSLNALAPLLTAVFSRIVPPALGPTAFMRFFKVVHTRLAAPPNAYNNDLRVCVDAYVRAHDGEWPSGMPLLSSTSQTQSQFQMNGQLTMEVPVSPAVWRVAGEHTPHLRSIEVIIRVPHLGLLLKQIPCGTVARSYPRLPVCHLTRGARHLITSKVCLRSCSRIIKCKSQITGVCQSV